MNASYRCNDRRWSEESRVCLGSVDVWTSNGAILCFSLKGIHIEDNCRGLVGIELFLLRARAKYGSTFTFRLHYIAFEEFARDYENL